jgi:hypothetical protein
MVKKKSQNKKKPVKIPKMQPKQGDLVYCHCVGDKYGWFMDRMAIVTELNTEEKDDYYKVYILDTQKSIFVNPNDFVETKVEIVSDYTIKQIDELKERRVNINKILNLDQVSERG